MASSEAARGEWSDGPCTPEARPTSRVCHRTAEEFGLRFDPTRPRRAGQHYPVCDYLIARGAAYVVATSAARRIALTISLGRYGMVPRRGGYRLLCGRAKRII